MQGGSETLFLAQINSTLQCQCQLQHKSFQLWALSPSLLECASGQSHVVIENCPRHWLDAPSKKKRNKNCGIPDAYLMVLGNDVL